MAYLQYDYSQINIKIMNTIKSWAQSSQDPTAIANTIKGIVLAASGIITFAALSFFHITLTATDIVNLATNLSIAGGAIWTVWGILMKGVMWFASVKAPTA